MTVSARQNVSAQRGDPVRTSFRVSVTLARGAPGQMAFEAAIAAWIFAPQGQPSLWYLAIPGATYRGLAYYDRQVPGYAPEAFSMARFLARNGIGLVVIDTLGTGESAAAVDGGLITRFVTADANAQVLDQVRERLLTGRLVADLAPVPAEALFLGGVGHSMGAFQLIQLAALLEDRGTPLDGAILVGWSHVPFDYERLQLDANAIFTQMVATNGYYAVPREVMRPVFYGPQPTVPDALIAADERDATPFPKGLMDEGLIPGIVAREAATLTSPVLYVAAAHDFCANAQAEGAVFHCAQLFTAYTQAGAAHCNFEESRQDLWRVIAGWTRMVAAREGALAGMPSATVAAAS